MAREEGPVRSAGGVAECPRCNDPVGLFNHRKRQIEAGSSRAVRQRLDAQAPPNAGTAGRSTAAVERQRSGVEDIVSSADQGSHGRPIAESYRVSVAPVPTMRADTDSRTGEVPTVHGHKLRRQATHVVCNLCGATRQYAQRNALSRCLYQKQVHIGGNNVRCAHVKGHVVTFDGNLHKCILCKTVCSKAASIARLKACIFGA